MEYERVIQGSQGRADGVFQDDIRDLSDGELDEISGGLSEQEMKKLVEDKRAILFKPPFSK